MAALRGLEETRWLIKGSQHDTILYTDHSSLKHVFGERSDATGRLARWNMRIQEYDMQIVHVPGRIQIVADGLSRLPHWRVESSEEDEVYTLPMLVCDE